MTPSMPLAGGIHRIGSVDLIRQVPELDIWIAARQDGRVWQAAECGRQRREERIRIAIGMAAFAVAALATLAAEARTYALVVGIDDYAHLPSLAGAVNDARDLAHVLRERGARVTLLINAEATRASVMDEWTAIVDAVQPGDSIVFTYAGHGAQLPEQLPGDEADGKDEVFLMHGFAIHGKDRGKLIRDNDIALMLEKIPPGVPVLVVADSCHSGTMTRAPDPRGDLGPTRYVEIGPAAGPAPLPPPPPQTRGVEAGDLPNVIFAYAAQDDQVTPEIRIDGQYRGALSWSVARALTHHLDGPPPSLGEFRSFVVAQVRALSGARQTPGVDFSRALAIRAAGEGIAALLTPTEAPPPPPPPPETSLVLAPPPTVHIRDMPDTRAVHMGGIRLTDDEESADLLWDRTRGQLVDRETADVIAEVPDAAALAGAVLAWRAVQPLRLWAPLRPLGLRIGPDGDRRYSLGDEIWITATQPAPAFRYLTIVNLASTGEVQVVFPSSEHVSQGLDRFRPGETVRRLGPVPVTQPTGEDHVLALASTHRLNGMHAALARLDGRIAPKKLLEIFNRYAADPANVRVGLLPVFTTRQGS